MLALGLLEIFTHYGAIRAAHTLLTPLLKPLLGIPGYTGLALITDLQSTDAGAALTKEMYDSGKIAGKEVVVMGAWQYSGAGLINNYFAIGSAMFASIIHSNHYSAGLNVCPEIRWCGICPFCVKYCL